MTWDWLVKKKKKNCSIRHMEFQTVIFGGMERGRDHFGCCTGFFLKSVVYWSLDLRITDDVFFYAQVHSELFSTVLLSCRLYKLLVSCNCHL